MIESEPGVLVFLSLMACEGLEQKSGNGHQSASYCLMSARARSKQKCVVDVCGAFDFPVM